MRIELSVTELKEIGKLIHLKPKDMLKLIREELPRSIGKNVTSLLRLEPEHFLEWHPYERQKGERNHRNGYYWEAL